MRVRSDSTNDEPGWKDIAPGVDGTDGDDWNVEQETGRLEKYFWIPLRIRSGRAPSPKEVLLCAVPVAEAVADGVLDGIAVDDVAVK